MLENMPKWAIYGGIGLAVFGLWYYKRNKNSASQSVPNQYQPPTLQQTNFQSGATIDNVPWEMTWPYNQLALPYNYDSANAQVVSNNTNMIDPQSQGFPGYSSTVVASG